MDIMWTTPTGMNRIKNKDVISKEAKNVPYMSKEEFL